MRYLVNYENSVVVIPKKALLDKLPDAGELELKFLLRFLADEELRSDYDTHADMLVAELKCDRSALDSALSYWRGAGIITPEKSTSKRKVARHATIPSYTGEELGRIIDENGLSMIIDECQRITGKVFNVTEVNRIAALNSYYGLEPEFILLLFTYCADKNKLSLKYIEKTAYDLSDQGIDTIEKLEEHIKKEEEKRSLESRLRRLFGWGERALTPTEKKHLTQWSDEFSYTEDVITEAYNITVEKTGKLSLPYLTKILSNWHGKGLHTLKDVQSAMEEYAKSKEDKPTEAKDSFDVDEFFELSLKRSREKMIKS